MRSHLSSNHRKVRSQYGSLFERAKELPESESLRIQFKELNERSRSYSSRIWQVPFVYFAVVAIAINAVRDLGLVKRNKQAVEHIRNVEQLLYLGKTADPKAFRINYSLLAMVYIVAATNFFFGILFLVWGLVMG